MLGAIRTATDPRLLVGLRVVADEGWDIDLTRAATRVPVFHAARIQDVATARHAIVAGKLDMVGMTRAHIAEPHIARLLAEGARRR